METKLTKPRLAYLDNLKALMIIFVIILHAGVTYSNLGSWYYFEPRKLGLPSLYFFAFFDSFLQAFFMSLFFMISAYFVPTSLDKKGTKKFIQDRLFRLGIPTLIFMFLINPFAEKMGHPNINLLEFYQKGLVSFRFLSWTGPMWFALTLLIFSFIYIPISGGLTKLTNKYTFAISVKNILTLVALITAIAFVIRLIYPIGTAVISLQFCYFSAYIIMFFMGIIAYQKKLFEAISYQTAKKWFIAAFAVGVPLWLLVIHFIVNQDGSINPLMNGGWNLIAFGWALWESFFCVAIIVGLIGIFKNKFNTQNSLQKFLSENAFGVYVFHAPVLVAVSVSLKNLQLQPVLKFILVSAITIPLSFIFVALIRKIKILQKIFS